MSDTIQKIREAVAKRLFKTRYVHESFKDVFGGPKGQEVLRFIMKKANVTKPTFVAGDPYKTAFNEGQRHLALSIAKYVHTDTDKLLEQIEQNMQKDDNE